MIVKRAAGWTVDATAVRSRLVHTYLLSLALALLLSRSLLSFLTLYLYLYILYFLCLKE